MIDGDDFGDYKEGELWNGQDREYGDILTFWARLKKTVSDTS